MQRICKAITIFKIKKEKIKKKPSQKQNKNLKKN